MLNLNLNIIGAGVKSRIGAGTNIGPTTTTTTLAGTIWCDCGAGCSEYLGIECPPGCTPCAAP